MRPINIINVDPISGTAVVELGDHILNLNLEEVERLASLLDTAAQEIRGEPCQKE